MIYRRPTFDEAETFAALHVQCWREAYSGYVPDELVCDVNFEARLPMWQNSLADGGRIVYGAYDAGQAVGFLIAGKDDSGNVSDAVGHLSAIYVAKSHLRKGIGRSLISLASKDWMKIGGKTLWLGVLSENKNAITFYERLGAKFVRESNYRWGTYDLPNKIYLFENLDALTR